MTFTVKLSPVMIEQLNRRDEKSPKLMWKKIKLIEGNPFHFKKNSFATLSKSIQSNAKHSRKRNTPNLCCP